MSVKKPNWELFFSLGIFLLCLKSLLILLPLVDMLLLVYTIGMAGSLGVRIINEIVKRFDKKNK